MFGSHSPYTCGSVVRYSLPFSATMQPDLVLGQPSTSASCCVPSPGPNVLSGVQGLAFGPDGSLFVGDTASNRIAVFSPPFQTFMNATAAIGQVNLTSYQPVSFAQGGLPDIVALAIDPSGKLWVLHNNHQYLSVYSPPFSTGMSRESWFDFVTGQTSNGSAFARHAPRFQFDQIYTGLFVMVCEFWDVQRFGGRCSFDAFSPPTSRASSSAGSLAAICFRRRRVLVLVFRQHRKHCGLLWYQFCSRRWHAAHCSFDKWVFHNREYCRSPPPA